MKIAGTILPPAVVAILATGVRGQSTPLWDSNDMPVQRNPEGGGKITT
jgi:hypothetical protein